MISPRLPYRFRITGEPDKRSNDKLGSAAPSEVLLALRTANRALQAFLTAQARTHRLSLMEFLVLSRAADPDGVTTVDAGRSLRLGSSTMTGLADRLETAGLVRRAAHPTDRRMMVLRATAKGRVLRDRALAALHTEIEELAASLAPSERAVVARFLSEVAALVVDQAGTSGRHPAANRKKLQLPPA